VVDDDSLACCQSQTGQERNEPADERESGQTAVAERLVSKEYRAVEDEDEVEDLAAESGHVADHHELVGVVHRLAQRLVTSTILSDTSLKFTIATDGTTEILVECLELVVENTGDHVVH